MCSRKLAALIKRRIFNNAKDLGGSEHGLSIRAQQTRALGLDQLCPARSSVEGFVRPSLGFSCSLQY